MPFLSYGKFTSFSKVWFSNLDYSTLIGFPSSQRVKLSINCISPTTSYVVNPNFLKYGSIECDIFMKESEPLYKIIVYFEIVPGLAKES